MLEKKSQPVRRHRPALMAVVNARVRGLQRGIALPLLLDLARKPVFLHDDSVASLDDLLDPKRGEKVPHPFYQRTAAARADMIAFLNSLGIDRDRALSSSAKKEAASWGGLSGALGGLHGRSTRQF
jgi:hypothetical protein